MNAYIQGLTMGLAYVAPIGLQNLFVINTALTQKRSRAWLTALIVIFFDVTLAFACFFGVGAVMERSHYLKLGILLVGSLIVIWIGVGLLRDKGSDQGGGNTDGSLKKMITTACVVTWFNPQAVIDGTMMLGAFRASLPQADGMKFIFGVGTASCLWFLGISTAVGLCGKRLNAKVLRGINVVCGIVVIFYGIKLFLSFVEQL